MRRIARVVLGIVCALALDTAYALTSDRDQPINIRARNVEANEKTGVSVYTGNVILTQGSLRLEAERLEVTLRDGRAQLIRAWGKPVRMYSRSDRGEELRSRSARAIYYATERKIDLYEDVEVKRDADVFTGAAAHYAFDQELFSAEGEEGSQVSVVIQPPKQEPSK